MAANANENGRPLVKEGSIEIEVRELIQSCQVIEDDELILEFTSHQMRLL